jgi:hypothetical protein
MANYQYNECRNLIGAMNQRRVDANSLRQQKRWRGAMYLLGYVIECKLKTRLMEKFKAGTLKELETKLTTRYKKEIQLTTNKGHSIALLMQLFPEQPLQKINEDAELRVAYNVCAQWQTIWRYDPKPSNEQECQSFFEKTERLLRYVDYSLGKD